MARSDATSVWELSARLTAHMNRKRRRVGAMPPRPLQLRLSLTVQQLLIDAERYHQAGRLSEAIACYQKVVDHKPDFADAHNNLGIAFGELERLDEAVACFRRAIKLRPDLSDAYNNLGSALQKRGRLDEAIVCFRKAIDLRPDFLHAAYTNLGAALQEQGQLDQAVVCFRKAIDLKPNFPIVHCNLGVALQQQGRIDDAIICFRRAVDLMPDYADAYRNLGIALSQQWRLDEATVCYRMAIDLKPNFPETHRNLGVVLQEQRHLDEAVVCYRRSLALKPDFADAHFDLAMALLTLGEMEAGWQEYEWRWKTVQMAAQLCTFEQPQWRGEAAQGRTLLIHAEQGFGDTLQFCRYAAMAAARGLRVIMQVQQPLVRLLRGLPGVDLVVARGEALPPFDLHCPMLSMPFALGTTLGTIPNFPSYVHADAAKAEVWRTRLAEGARPGLRVGLVWGASPHPPLRSVAPARLAPLCDITGLNFFSLQKEGPKAPKELPLTDFMDEMEDFADSAALIANLDLVISVDTAFVHLAGALGKPVWVLARFNPDWRWLDGRGDSPWYPKLRLYRQPQFGDWDSIVADVARDLHCLLSRTN